MLSLRILRVLKRLLKVLREPRLRVEPSDWITHNLVIRLLEVALVAVVVAGVARVVDLAMTVVDVAVAEAGEVLIAEVVAVAEVLLGKALVLEESLLLRGRRLRFNSFHLFLHDTLIIVLSTLVSHAMPIKSCVFTIAGEPQTPICN
jgi:hypothetical protein